MGKGKLRLDGGVEGYRTLLMKIRNEGDGWICSKVKKAILHKNAEIRAAWQNGANGWVYLER